MRQNDKNKINYIQKYKNEPIEYSQKVKNALASIFPVKAEALKKVDQNPKVKIEKTETWMEVVKEMTLKIQVKMETESESVQINKAIIDTFEEVVQVTFPEKTNDIPPPPPALPSPAAVNIPKIRVREDTPPESVKQKPLPGVGKTIFDEIKERTPPKNHDTQTQVAQIAVAQTPAIGSVKKARRASRLDKFKNQRKESDDLEKGGQSKLPQAKSLTIVASSPLNSQSFINSISNRGQNLRSAEDSDDESSSSPTL
jgi:hypothetical protein